VVHHQINAGRCLQGTECQRQGRRQAGARKIDEARRIKGQEALAAEWAVKAKALLDMAKLNIADALAWQRDAAKAGAPLSREPLAGLKTAAG
jgi:ATP-dependent RNA helicase SUPV3L1/SUV3